MGKVEPLWTSVQCAPLGLFSSSCPFGPLVIFVPLDLVRKICGLLVLLTMHDVAGYIHRILSLGRPGRASRGFQRVPSLFLESIFF